MLIEVVKSQNSHNIDKGNLLENLTADFMRTQGFDVSKQVRVTAAELDLLCKHRVSGKEVYVECKARRGTLSSNVLNNILGKIELHDYEEGWLISTGYLGKEAKGFMDLWEKKDSEKRGKLRIYTPKRVLKAFWDANIITRPPKEKAAEFINDPTLALGDWILIITLWGNHWVCPILHHGVTKSIVLYCAKSNHQITDPQLFEQLKSSDFSLREFEFLNAVENRYSIDVISKDKESPVVEVEFGEKWFDYRPARPEHFVGRKKAQKELLQFFSKVKSHKTDTRIFAVKGDSGIGKSSLLAKMRDVTKNSQKPNNLFLFAVDVRAANDSSYIYSSLIACLKSAASQGFGRQVDLKVTNHTDPLQSDSIRMFIDECEKKRELIIIVFDQFEELYSKPGLFSVFEEAKRLMFSTISASSNIVLGFAWKTDSTVPQDHPAYHMWHQLSDHRFEITLKRFSHSDAEQSLKIFEAELGERIRPELRKYLLGNCQGYPWLLKKLCIHLYEQLKNGISQHQVANQSLDITSLFNQDLNNLTDSEMVCLKLVAHNAPMDWYEVLKNTGHEVVQSLQGKRLLIRHGDKLNLYWDIFRDYVLSGNIPPIPFTYIPQSPSIGALLRVSLELDNVEGMTSKKLASNSDLKESTVRNIIHDLDQFGLIRLVDNEIFIDDQINDLNARSILLTIRLLFKRHALTEILKKNNTMRAASKNQIISYLKEVIPTAQYHIRTWKTYSKRMVAWLQSLGLINVDGDEVIYNDIGDIVEGDAKKWGRKRRRIVFLGDTSPAKVIEAFKLLREGQKSQVSMKNLGYRNACAVLYRFNLIELTVAGEYRVSENMQERSAAATVWEEARKEDSLKLVIDKLKDTPSLTPEQIGKYVAKKFKRNWKKTSCKRVGNSLRQWAGWLLIPLKKDGSIPNPPGYMSNNTNQLSLPFELSDE